MPREREPIPLFRRQVTHDYEHQFAGFWQSSGKCRVRVYESSRLPPVVIATELPDNEGTSITNMAEYLAAEILVKHFPHRIEHEEPMIWVEHYPRGPRDRLHAPEYAYVTFAYPTPRIRQLNGTPRLSLGQPTWTFLSTTELRSLLGRLP